MSQKSSIFDMIGPVMIGPSSSHTAGVVKIAKVAYSFLGGDQKQPPLPFIIHLPVPMKDTEAIEP